MKNLHLSSSMTIYFFYFFSFLNSKVFMWNFTYSFILSQWQKLLVFSPKSVSPSFFIDSDFLQGSGMPKVRHISQPVRYLEVAIWHSSDRHGSLWGECPHDKKDKMLKKEACLALPLPFFSFFLISSRALSHLLTKKSNRSLPPLQCKEKGEVGNEEFPSSRLQSFSSSQLRMILPLRDIWQLVEKVLLVITEWVSGWGVQRPRMLLNILLIQCTRHLTHTQQKLMSPKCQQRQSWEILS